MLNAGCFVFDVINTNFFDSEQKYRMPFSFKCLLSITTKDTGVLSGVFLVLTPILA